MALRDEGCAARAVIQQLDATAATKNEVQRISTIYVGGKQDTSDFAILRRVYMCDVDGCRVSRGAANGFLLQLCRPSSRELR